MLLSKRQLQHLYWRAGFGLSPQEWQERRHWSREQAIRDLFSQAASAAPIPQPALPEAAAVRNMSQAERQEVRRQERLKVITINYDWVLRMGNPAESALLERMCLFWHDHFACESKSGRLATQQLNSIRAHALGNFKDLVLAMAKDPAMIRYLNNQQNRKRQPNENFARELLELFTVGHGNYSEQDIKEAARAFTGWFSNLRGQYTFRARQHDFGSKVFMGRRGDFNGDDIIDIILEQPAAARYICRKIYAYFVNEKVDEQRVAELADAFYHSAYDIGQLMRRIFSSDWFYAAENIGSKIKSPVELLAGLIRQLQLSNISQEGILGLQRALGQRLFKPPNVAGWPGGKSWIDNSTLMLRLNLAAAIFRAADLNYELDADLEGRNSAQLRRLEIEMDLAPLLQLTEGLSAREAQELLAGFLLQPASAIPAGVQINNPVNLHNHIIQLLTLPEYQLC